MSQEFKYVCADVETTGLNSWPKGTDEVIEIAATEFNLDGRRGRTLHFMCEPKMGYIPFEVSEINGIFWEDVVGHPNYLEGGVREQIAEFIGNRILVGHNIDEFDIGFIMIQPAVTFDTLKLSRAYFSGKHNLRVMCSKMKIEWDQEKAHRATYDVDRNIELFIKLQKLVVPNRESLDLFMKEVKAVSGITPLQEDVDRINSMVYSYSRVNSFQQCKLKWYYNYLRKIGETKQTYFVVGSTCHLIAELCGKWCHKKKWVDCYTNYSQIKKLKENPEAVAIELYDNKKSVASKTGFSSFSELYYEVINTLSEHNVTVEGPRMPDIATFNNFVTTAIAREGCNNPDMVNEVNFIMGNFYKTHDFTSLVGEVSAFERKMAVDRAGNPVDFDSKNAFWRGIADMIDIYEDSIVITDYKSSRTMLSQEDMANDMQTKTYLYLLAKISKIENDDGTLRYNRIVFRIDYLRFNQVVEHAVEGVDNIKALLVEVETWIKESAAAIESEVGKTANAFIPERNEYCSGCNIAEFGYCNLFNNMAEGIDDLGEFIIGDAEDCKRAWKQIEKNQNEIKRLQSEAKNYVKLSDEPILIDDKARLSFYTTETASVDLDKLIKFLDDNDIRNSLDLIKKYGSMSKTNFEKLAKRIGVEVSDEVMEKVGVFSRRTEFKALTESEIESGKYLNV